MVPAFTGWVRLADQGGAGDLAACVGVLAIPGTITHALLGNIEWSYALPLCDRRDPRSARRRAPRDPLVRPHAAALVGIVLGAIAVVYAVGELLALA